jgi:hypothetical protein
MYPVRGVAEISSLASLSSLIAANGRIKAPRLGDNGELGVRPLLNLLQAGLDIGDTLQCPNICKVKIASPGIYTLNNKFRLPMQTKSHRLVCRYSAIYPDWLGKAKTVKFQGWAREQSQYQRLGFVGQFPLEWLLAFVSAKHKILTARHELRSLSTDSDCFLQPWSDLLPAESKSKHQKKRKTH